MNRILHFCTAIGLTLSVSACIFDVFESRNGKFQSQPIPLEKFNSEFDDYNSNLPQNKYGDDYLVFSSKRARQKVFNLVTKYIYLQYNDKTDLLSASDTRQAGGTLDILSDAGSIDMLVNAINQDHNVLGPLMVSFDRQIFNTGNVRYKQKMLLLYADDSKGNLEIKFVHNFNNKDRVEGPFEVTWLNSPQDDAYPTFDRDFSKLYFCSNRNGNFDIFEAELPTDRTKLLETLLAKTPIKVTKNTQLSSSADDKCPHLPNTFWNNTMYFVSNRTGGLGGYDIYFSTLSQGQWSTPQNIGDRINTKYDEYRPMTFMNPNFSYDLGIFSSNRPGGKGGFDLYMAGFLTEKEMRPANQ